MCYSAMVVQDLKSISRQLRAQPALPAFEELFHARLSDRSIKIPKAMEANFAAPELPAEKRIKLDIDQHHERLTQEYESNLFSQRKRLADAERALDVRQTKKAVEEMRIAGSKIAWIQ